MPSNAAEPTKKAVRPARMARNAGKAHMSPTKVRQVQAQLKSEGLYRGRVDGIMGHRTQLALSRSQQATGMHRMASHRPLGNRTTGAGSSTQGAAKPMTAPTTSSQTGAGGDNATNRPNVKGY